MTSETAALELTLGPVDDLSALEREWLGLQARSDHSFFQSWGWIGCWLRLLPTELRPQVLRARRQGATVGLAILVERRIRRRGLIRSRAIHLHETGRHSFDKLTIEHNGIVAEGGLDDAVRAEGLRLLGGGLAEGRWEEVFLPAVAPEYEVSARVPGTDLLVWKREPSYRVDLARASRDAGGYLACLSRNRRSRIRRCLRLYRDDGPLQVLPAQTGHEAHRFLDALIALHEARWTARGDPGAFAPPFLDRFHHELIDTRFDAGEIQLLRVSTGDRLVGYDYNFVYQDYVYWYQWGLVRQPDRRRSPGTLVGYATIEYNRARGASVLDLLHGDELHKRLLSTDAAERVWLVMQRRRLDFRIENALRRLRRRRASARGGVRNAG